MQQIFRMKDAAGNEYDVPNSDLAEFSGAVKDAQPVNRYRDTEGNSYDVPASDIQEFRAAVPSHEQVRTMTFADGSKRDFTLPELNKFLRSKEWREGDEYKADRDERDRIVAERVSDGKTSDTSFLEEYSKGLADSGGTAIGRTLGGALSRFSKFTGWLAANARPMGTEGVLTSREFHPEEDEAPSTTDTALPMRRYKGSAGRAISGEIEKATDILYPEAPQTDSAVAQGIGKAIGLGAGLAEFSLTPTAILSGGHFVEGWEQAYDAAKARGATDEEATTLGLVRGGTDAAITTAFKKAPVHRIVGALGYKPSPAVLEAIAKAGEKGISGVSRGSVATAIGKQMLANAAISATEMGSLGGLQSFIDDAVMQEAEKGEIDWNQSWKTFGNQALEQGTFGAVMGLLPTPVKVREAVKQRDAILRETLADPMGVVAYARANPEAGKALADAWRKDGKVSRRVAREAGLPEMDEVSRNNIGETIALYNDFEARPRPAPESRGGEPPLAPIPETPKQEATNETRNGADEAPAKPAEGTAGEPKVGEAADAKAAEPPRAEAPREGVVEPPAETPKAPEPPPAAAEPPKTPQEPSAEAGQAKETPTVEKPPEAVSAAPAAEQPKKPKRGKAEKPKPPDTTPLSDAIAEAKALAKEGEVKQFEVKVGTTTVKFSNEKPESIAGAEKMLKKLQRPTDWNKKPSGDSLPKPPSITIATGKKVGGFDDVSGEFVAKGKGTAEDLQKPIIQNGNAYATDGRVMLRMKAPEGAKDNNPGRNCEGVFEQTTKNEPEFTFNFDVGKANTDVEQVKTIAQTANYPAAEMWLSPEGEIMFRARQDPSLDATKQSEAIAFAGSSLKGARFIGAYDPQNLTKVIKAFAKLGEGNVEVEWRGERAPLVFKGKNAEVLMMGQGSDATGGMSGNELSLLMGGKTNLSPAEAKEVIDANPKLKGALEKNPSGQDPLYSPASPAKETVADTIADLDRIIASEEAGKPSGGETAAEGLPARSESWAPGKGVSRVKAFFGGLVSKNSVVRAIKDTFPEFAVRGKNTTRIGASYSGHFEPWRELVRSKDMADIDTIPHEIGHGISMRTKRRMMNIPQEAKRDLARMGRELYGSKKPNGGYMEEGWAEYIRGYMTGADDLATQAPHLDKWFREKFAEAHPDYVRKIDRIRKEIMRYRVQSDLQRAAAEQNPETSAMRRAWEKVEDFFSAENWDDEGATLTRGYEKSGLAEMHKWQGEMRELEKLYKKGQGNSPRAAELQKSIEEKVLTDPRIFASNARGTSKARTLDMMKYGITNLTGTEKVGDVTGFDANGNAIRNNNTESYRDIFGNFTGKELKQWDLYAAAKIGLENYVKKGKEFGVDKAALERRVAALENPKFLDALDRFTKMSRRALSVGLEAGALTPEQYQKIVGEHQYYVRTERRLAEDGAGGGRSQSNPIHKIKGSTKNIMPPRVATMMQIEKQLRYFQTMKVLNMLAKDVRKAEVANGEFYKTGNGREYQVAANLPVQVANAQEAVKFGSEKLRKDLTKKMVDTGAATDKAAADALFDQLFNDGADQLTVFRERPSKGKNGLVSTYIDGKLVTFELPDAKWAKYITGMESSFDNGPSGLVWNIITAPSKLLRLGATTANPAFATANFVRDTFHSAIMSETGAKPLVSSVTGMLNDVLGMDSGRLFKQMGGEMSMLMGSNKEAQFKHMQNAALADNILKQIAADTSLVNPLSGILRVYTDILSKPEMGPRVREVMGVMKRGQAAGLDRETSAWLAFAAGKDISVDFGKHGKYMKVLNQVIPYTNAWYRGLEQFARNMGMKKSLPTQFEDRQGVRAMRTAGRVMLYLSATAVANGIAKMLTMDEKERRDEFNKTPREKWEYDDILGVRVPMPFELGAVFYAIPKAVVYEAFGDKGAVKEAIWHGLSTNLGKYSNVEDFTSGITVIAPFVDMLRNKKWDKSPLVSPHIMDAYPKDRQKWYDYSTTEAAKWVGEKMNWAPAYIDHVANTWTGGMWKRLLSPAADTTLATQTGASTFIPRPTARRDVHEFYDSRSELQSHYNAGSASAEDVGKLARANKLQEKLSPLFKEARELAATEPDKAERRRKREAIMDKAFDLIHEYKTAEADDRKGGLAHAADALTRSAEIEPSVREKNLAVLKGASYDEIKAALRAYGKEKLPVAVKNKAGFKTGRIKYERRWSDETIRLRIRRLYKEFHGEE